jgi:DNA ligase D-like protein (predicted 3'-phosphoesterase)
VTGEDHPRFVLYEHFAHHHHFDFRLEKEGGLKSWAVPKGLPEKSGERRLAIEVEDHPIEYIGFKSTIPESEYGAGEVKIQDAGTYNGYYGAVIELRLSFMVRTFQESTSSSGLKKLETRNG